MKILFLTYHGFSDHSGISKKIHYQVKGLRENGHDVRLCYYGFAADGHRCRYVDGEVLKDYGTGAWAGLRQRMDYDCIADYCVREGIQFVYARCFQNANPWLIRFFKKLQSAGIRAVTEIPTYPYDAEFRNFFWKERLGLKIDQLFRRSLYKHMDAVVTFSDAEEIFGQRTIRISNGVDFDSIPIHQYCAAENALSAAAENAAAENTLSAAAGQTKSELPLHLIGVAEVHIWHGYDRLIAGLGEYYKKGGKRDVVFHIVGGVHPQLRYSDNEYHPALQTMIDRYQIAERVVFHGTLFGAALDDVFNQCQFAIGSLGRHRSGITVIKTLKNREYATRGIPFVYSEQDSDFDTQPYVLKAPADETPVDVQRIIDFVDHFNIPPADIRKTVEHLTWKIQMERVVTAVFE